ncbi:MAG: hypothetical protein VYA55_15000 [Pseudomonadota bacterium]|nr:hypothetical protein [Pseudomonadota bacterium]
MDFSDTLTITIIDKLIIGVFLAWLAFFYGTRLEKYKKDQEFRLKTAASRLNAYLKLWALTESLSLSDSEVLTYEDKERLYSQLRSWYYEDGNGVFLPLETADLFLKAKEKLNPKLEINQKIISDSFSALRTQLKVDIGTYDIKQATKKIGIETVS